MRKRKSFLFGIPRYCCFAGGGAAAQPADPAPADPAAQPADPAAKPADPAAKPTDPAAKPTDPAAKPADPTPALTTEQLEAAKQQAVDEYKKHLEEAKDFEKMTADEKVVYLQKQMADEKLTGYTTNQLSVAGLPVELAAFAKGTDEKDTNERLKTLKAAYDKGVQAGVEKRFKANGYVPKETAADSSAAEKKARPRGVSVK